MGKFGAFTPESSLRHHKTLHAKRQFVASITYAVLQALSYPVISAVPYRKNAAAVVKGNARIRLLPLPFPVGNAAEHDLACVVW